MMTIQERPYVVFSWEHNAFWRPARCGYTRIIEKAGRYSREEAEAICRDADYRTYAEQKNADPDVPPSEICFPAPEAADLLDKAKAALGMIASCDSHHPDDVVAVAREALARLPTQPSKELER